MDADLTKMWARIQEGLLNLIDRAEALQQMMDRNPRADQPVAEGDERLSRPSYSGCKKGDRRHRKGNVRCR